MGGAGTTRPLRVLRFQMADRQALARLDRDPLTGVDDLTRTVEAFRDLHFDTPIGDLHEKGAAARLRINGTGASELIVHVVHSAGDEADAMDAGGGPDDPERGMEVPGRRQARAAIEGADPGEVWAGSSEPARLLRSLIDPSRLEVAFELETLRRVRTGRLGGGEVAVACDVITARRGELAVDLYQAELTLPAEGAAVPAGDALLERLRASHRLRPLLAEPAGLARQVLAAAEVDVLARGLRSAREVAVVPYREGAVGLVRSEAGNLVVPTGPGTGAEGCRRVLRRVFGRSQGRIRVLGRTPGLAERPTLEVWLAEEVVSGGESASGLFWLPLNELIARAGAPGLRDGATLAALTVVARAELPTGPAPDRVAADGLDSEAIDAVLERMQASGPDLPQAEVPPHLLLNAELSRLSFDERMLVIAEEPATPLLERVRFLAMFATRRDDFFMTRVARFKAAVAQGKTSRTADGLRPGDQLAVIGLRSRSVMARAYELLRGRLIPDLERQGIRLLGWDELADEDRELLGSTYGPRLDALLTPIVADPAHPFPHVRNLRPALAAVVRLPDERTEHLVAVELPGDLPRFLPLPGQGRFVSLEDLIVAQLPALYPGVELVRAHTFRVTRSAEIDLEAEAGDVLRTVEEELELRPFQQIVRLEVESAMPEAMSERLLREFQQEGEGRVTTLGPADVYRTDRLVDLAALGEIYDVDRDDLKWSPLEQRRPFPPDRSVFDLIREQDRLLRFPLDRFEDSVERLLLEAADDPQVVAIKTTLYRTSDRSGVVDALRRARRRGKDAVVLVELKASFDERRNIAWAKDLQASGIRVVFSPPRYKVHAKIALIVRREEDRLRRYVYIGTGNLNATTAATYVDVGLLTCDDRITAEVAGVFNLLTGYTPESGWERLLVAPFNMRDRFLELIAREASLARDGQPATIRAQLNGLADRRLIAALYDASRAGVPIELTVREICSLRPGVPGVSETIQVRSRLGRLLQHARIFHFHNGGDDLYFIGSADWRPRNLSDRIEVITPVTQPDHRRQLDDILIDTFHHPAAWTLRPDGRFERDGTLIEAGWRGAGEVSGNPRS